MTSFDQKFIENQRFLKWVFNTSPADEFYWEQYLQEHPEEKTKILELKNLLSQLRFSNDTLSVNEKEEIARDILKQIGNDQKILRLRSIARVSLKYAAVAIVILSIGGFLFYRVNNKEALPDKHSVEIVQIPTETEGPLLITSSGKNVALKKANSTVDYSLNGKIVLNSDSVIQASVQEADMPNQLIIPFGNQSKVVLSDNTVVWLNAGSRLIYPTSFKGNTREVSLYGEAFFEVTQNPGKPFIVKTSNLEIRVLGTKFNVSAYEEDNLIQTVLKEGKVSIRGNGGNIFEKEIIIKPNQMASFDKKSRDTKIYEVDADYYRLWTQGLISFNEIDLNRIIKKLEKYYNISVNFSDPKLESMHLSGKLDLKHGRKDAIEYLEKVTGSKFEKIKENQYIVK